MIEKADSSDSKVLTEITLKSKAHWGYCADQLNKWKELLTITEAYIIENSVYKLTEKTRIVAYYSFISNNTETVELDNLFILPEYIGKGFGRILLEDFFERIKSSNTKTIILESDPNAEDFYTKFGFKVVGQCATGIKGRYLSKMEQKINQKE